MTRPARSPDLSPWLRRDVGGRENPTEPFSFSFFPIKWSWNAMGKKKKCMYTSTMQQRYILCYIYLKGSPGSNPFHERPTKPSTCRKMSCFGTEACRDYCHYEVTVPCCRVNFGEIESLKHTQISSGNLESIPRYLLSIMLVVSCSGWCCRCRYHRWRRRGHGAGCLATTRDLNVTYYYGYQHTVLLADSLV